MSQEITHYKIGKQKPNKRSDINNWSINGKGVNLNILKSWQNDNFQTQLTDDDSKQDIALLKMRKYVIFSRKVIYVQVRFRYTLKFLFNLNDTYYIITVVGANAAAQTSLPSIYANYRQYSICVL